jgi:phosphoribosylaminoimidazole-succinocarboxamide synthase
MYWSTAYFHSNCPDLKLVARGKVRDLYEVDEKSLLFVATDRISAFDVIMKNVSIQSIFSKDTKTRLRVERSLSNKICSLNLFII